MKHHQISFQGLCPQSAFFWAEKLKRFCFFSKKQLHKKEQGRALGAELFLEAATCSNTRSVLIENH